MQCLNCVDQKQLNHVHCFNLELNAGAKESLDLTQY